MAVDSVRQGTVSGAIQDLAASLMARERVPLTNLQQRRADVSKQSSILTTLKTRMSALRSQLNSLDAIGTLSPFSAKAASSSDTSVLTATAAANAANAAVSVTVQQLARRATHTSDLLTDTATTISSGGTGTFNFTVTIAGTNYNASVTINAGDTDKAVLDNVAAAINTAVGTKGSASRLQVATGQSRLSISSANTGTANKITFTDTNSLLARLGVFHAVPTAATATTGGYVFDDLGNHELDAQLLVDGQQFYRDSNTITDILTGVTISLKAPSASTVTLTVKPDADAALAKVKSFVSAYNDVIDYLVQNAGVSPDGKTRGPLAGDSTYSSLRIQLRQKIASIVQSQPAGSPNSLAVLGITAGSDGKLTVDEAKFKDTYTANPTGVTSLFNATDGVATLLDPFVNNYSGPAGLISASQTAITGRLRDFDSQITRLQASLDKRQRNLEQQLAKQQALLDGLARQQSQIASFMARLGG
ncbi:MAG: flagellar filament capping protein FliD [Candidatus Rokubacteria bacterium]|nr:flagellar filament capping protein FliD [Candidatus Rokubacteria bacterium]